MTREMTVTQLASYLKGVFDDEELLHDVTLSGEVAEVSYSDRHTFITLCDGCYSVRCAHFMARDRLEKGNKITLHGSVSFYDRRSAITFVYDGFSLTGTGDKNAELLKRKERLREMGLFENRPKLPEYVFSVAVLTSADGAAIHDFVRVTGEYCKFIDIRVFPVRVQGDGAASGIVREIKKIQSGKFDAIVLCRGGGSDEDLDCFNNEELAVAVAQSRIPVVSAIGHEVDYTLCDFCAGTRAGTPSIAGQIIGERGAAFIYDLRSLAARALSALEMKFVSRRLRLDRLGLRITAALEMNLQKRRHSLETVAERGVRALERKNLSARNTVCDAARQLALLIDRLTEKKRMGLEKLSAVLSALDPQKIRLGRVAVTSNGQAVSKASELGRGDEVLLIFGDGTASATVTGVELKR